MRLRNIANARNLLGQHSEQMILDPVMHRGKWNELFGNSRPIFLEIGMGKGQFISSISKRNPHINFIGLEKYDSVAVRALQKLIREPRPNVLLARGEAENLLDYFSPNEIGQIILNFSDPWPRKSNEKRRMTHVEFLEKYRNILVPGGEIHLKTDSRAFFEFSLLQMNNHGMKISGVSFDLHSAEPEDNIRTEYEESRSAAGHAIHRLVGRFE
jgi:tRNA (guanine-N7-)-methyltransferase